MKIVKVADCYDTQIFGIPLRHQLRSCLSFSVCPPPHSRRMMIAYHSQPDLMIVLITLLMSLLTNHIRLDTHFMQFTFFSEGKTQDISQCLLSLLHIVK